MLVLEEQPDKETEKSMLTSIKERLQFFNKETSLARAKNRNVIGYSRDLSDAYVRAIYTQGKGRLRNQELVAQYFGKKKIDEGGRS